MSKYKRIVTWLHFALCYALVALPTFALWEFAHAPLYSLWVERGADAGMAAALHCTFGDGLIAFTCALASMLIVARVPALRTPQRARAVVIALGVLATVVIELISTQWLGRWQYRDVMPVDPIFGVGLSPVAQWVVVPVISLHILRHRLQQALT